MDRLSYRYEILGELGRGSEGVVYRVVDLLNNRAELALKLSLAPASEAALSRLGRELGHLLRLHHPCIARARDFGVLHDPVATHGEPHVYYTRDLVPGAPLPHRPAPATLQSWAESLLRTLGFLHGQGLLHRDLKPENILLAEEGPGGWRGEPTLIDFGLSGRADGPGAGAGGTLAYAAPELLEGASTSVATDLYSLGATLLELAKGEPPVLASEPGAAVREILSGEPHRRAALLTGLPTRLAELIGSLLEPDPAARPASAREGLSRLTGKPEEPLDRGLASTQAPFVGRDELLGEMSLGAVAGPGTEPGPAGGGFVHLVGDAGVGKSRLLSELRWRLQLARRPVIMISCREQAGRGTVDLFATAARCLAPSTPTPPPGSGGDPAAMEALWQTFARVADRKGLWLLVDDAGEADDDGKAWLRYLCRAAPDAQMTLVVASRGPGDLGSLDGAMERAVPPLDRAAASELISHLAGDLPDRVLEMTLALGRGNPALLTHLAHHLRRQGSSVASAPDLADLALPPSLIEAERWRLSGALGPPPWPLLQRLALCNEPLEPELLLWEPGDRERLEQLVAAGVVPANRQLCGPLEPLLRDAVLADLDGEMRRELHCDWIRKLGEEGGSSLLRAHHHLHGGHLAAGLEDVREAAYQLRRRGATSRAAEHAAWCLRVAEGSGASPDLLARLRRELAEMLLESGRLEEAWARIQKLETLGLPEDLALACALTRAEILERLGRLEEAENELAPLMRSGSEAARLALHRARLQLRRGRHRAALKTAEKGLALTSNHTDRSRLLNVAGAAHTYLGDTGAAREKLEEAVRLASIADDPRAEAAATTQLAMAASSQGDLPEAERLYRRALALAEEAGLGADLPGFALNLGTVLQERGRPGEALDLYRRAAAQARRLGREGTLANALANLGNLLGELGAHGEARLALQDAGRRARAVGLDLVDAMTLLYLAEVDWHTGHLSTALEGATRAAARLGELGMELRRLQALLTAAQIALDSDQPETAAALLAEPQQARGELRRQLAPQVHLLEGRLATRAPNGQALAEQELEMGLRQARDRGDDGLMAALLLARAQSRLAVGETGPGLEDARQALGLWRNLERELPSDLLRAFWADPRRSALLALLDRSSENPPAPPPPPPGSAEEGPESPTRVTPTLLRILRFNRDLLAERDVSRLLERVMDTAVELTGAERGFLLLRDGEGKLSVEVARNIDRETIRRGGLTFSRSLAQEVAESGTSILTISAQDDARLQVFASVSELRLKSVMGVPIRTADRILGTLYLDNRFVRGRFGERDLELLQSFADQVAVVLENARMTLQLGRQREELELARQELERLNRQQAAELAQTKEALEIARRDLKHEYPQIIGRSPAMRRVLELVDRVVDHDVPVLIGGESGTGKELLARTLHEHGPRKDHPFVAVNCGALPEALLESELFGHTKGAFTGAHREHSGLFAQADGGTLLLDEVGEMSPAMQTKLLRVLQEGRLRPVGATGEVAVDVRILAATNRDLAELVERGEFRQDLYYRLNVVSLVLPPLRSRPEDLPALVSFFAERAAERLGLPERRFTRAAMGRLLACPWPGNVRELENVVANAMIMADGDTIGPGDLTLSSTATLPGRRGRRLEDLERDAVEAALRETGGNRTRAAKILGISRVTLQRKLKRWRTDP